MAKVKGFALHEIQNSHAKFYHTEVKIIFLPVFTLYDWDPLFETPFHTDDGYKYSMVRILRTARHKLLIWFLSICFFRRGFH